MMTIALAAILAVDLSNSAAGDPNRGSVALPRSLAEDLPGTPEFVSIPVETEEEAGVLPYTVMAAGAPGPMGGFSIGPAGGYLKVKGAQRGTWFAGAQARLHFLQFFAAEASITFHENSFQGGTVHETQYPVQVSGMLYPLPDSQFQPYIVAGGGWYYTRFTYTGILSGISNQTDHVFGGHVGGGLEILLGPQTSIDADIRYIFVNPSSSQVKSGQFDYWQITFGLNLFF